MRVQVGREINFDLAQSFMIETKGYQLKSGNVRVGYKNIPKDAVGWIDCSRFLPINYDLVCVKLISGLIKNCWWAEKKWDGLRLKPKDKVSHWRYIQRG